MKKVLVLAAIAIAFSASEGFAVSKAVKKACSSDYLAHCGEHAVGSPGVRKCMRAHRNVLSAHCVRALKASGEVSASDLKKSKKSKKSRKKHRG